MKANNPGISIDGWRVRSCGYWWLEVEGPRYGIRGALANWRAVQTAVVIMMALTFPMFFVFLIPSSVSVILKIGAMIPALILPWVIALTSLAFMRQREIVTGVEDLAPPFMRQDIEHNTELVRVIREIFALGGSLRTLPREVRADLVSRLEAIAAAEQETRTKKTRSLYARLRGVSV